jgi:hypothetical protein
MHPELIHLPAEQRCDKRLELAALKRAYEVANATKTRILEEICDVELVEGKAAFIIQDFC